MAPGATSIARQSTSSRPVLLKARDVELSPEDGAAFRRRSKTETTHLLLRRRPTLPGIMASFFTEPGADFHTLYSDAMVKTMTR